jgi:hypothetical protein
MDSRVPSRTLCSLLEIVLACPFPQKDWATLLHTCHRHRYLLVTKLFATKHLLPLFQCLQKLPCWNPLVISFCSSSGSTFLLIERTTIEPRALAGHQQTGWKRHARTESNNMYGRAFLGASTLHSSTKFLLGGSVYRGTQEYSMLQTPEVVWRLDYTW